MWAATQLNAARFFAHAQGSRKLSGDDWSDRIPLVIGAFVVVLLVNGVGMYFVSRTRRNERNEAARS